MFRILVSGRVFYINKIPKKLPQGFLTPSPKVPLLSRLVRFLDRRPWMILQAENKKKTSQVPTIPQKKVDVGQFCSQFKKKKVPPLDMLYPIMFFFEWRLKWLGITPIATHGRSGPGWRFFLPFRRVTVRRLAAPKRPFQSYGPRSLLMKRRQNLLGEVVHIERFLMVFLGLRNEKFGQKLKVDTVYCVYS